MKLKISPTLLIVVIVIIFAGGFILLRKPQPSQQSTSLEQTQTGEAREIAVTAKQWQFSPNPIRVKLGERVRLRIKSVDVAHGFALPDFGINEVLQPGKEVVVEFTADKKGTFSFFCSVQCGVGHSNMRGSLIVE